MLEGEMLWNTTFPQFYMYMHMLKDKERLKKTTAVMTSVFVA